MVNLELYRVFYTVAKCGSLTKAAEALFISQPAVSQAIKQLETQLGGKLFNRVSRGMELTELGGKQMFEVVSNAINLLDSAENKFLSLKSIATGTVRIGAADSVIKCFLLRYVKEFKNLYPDVNLSFSNCTSRECVELIKNDKVDIGFVNLPLSSQSVMFTGQTGNVHDIFVTSPSFCDLYKRVVNFSELSNYPLLLLDESTMTRKLLIDFAESININLQPDFELGSYELLVQMTKEAFGIACVPREYVSKELSTGELKEIKTEPSLPTRSIGVVVNNEKSHSFAVNEFLKLLNKYKIVE